MISRFMIEENGYSVVLLAKKSSIFYRDSLKKFTKNIPSIIQQDYKKNFAFTVAQIKLTNKLLESSFGRQGI